jgi:hypothetical protein
LESIAGAPTRTLVRGASSVLVLVVIALAVMTYRAVRDGNQALRSSDLAFHRGDLADSVLYARRAATAYAPGAPHTRAARERLRAIAVGSEAAGDAETARLAWSALRAAALETRHVTVPYAAELREANERLERLASRPKAQPDERLRAQAERDLGQALGRIPGPSPWASALLGLGFVLAVGGLVVAGAQGLTREERIVWQRLGPGLGAFTAGALLWAFAVYFA